ncbi:MAG TPA: NFACT family protein [Fimbriimonadales bacterium]|nr:NFACT family protein [Fimbriimonadales bacterium]
MEIPFDSLCLAKIAAEMQPAVGGILRRIFPFGKNGFVFRIVREGYDAHLIFTCHPRLFRCHVLSCRPKTEESASSFFPSFRQRIEGGKILSIRQHGFDRILIIEIGKASGVWSVICEFFGTHSNILLVSPEGKIAELFRKTRKRTRGGAFVLAPPIKSDIEEAFRTGKGLSPFLLREIELSGKDEVLRKFREGPPVLIQGRGAYPFAPVQLEKEKAIPMSSLSLALENFARSEEPKIRYEERVRTLKSQLEKALKKRCEALKEIEAELESSSKFEDWQRQGEILLAHSHRIPPGVESVTLEDFEGNPIEISLDPKVSPIENAENLFKKAKKAKKNRQSILRLREIKQSELSKISKLLSELENLQMTGDTKILDSIENTAKTNGWLREPTPAKRAEEKPFEGHKIRKIEAPGGFVVLWGENAEANDYLTTRVAKPNDYWLHVRGHSGAHVVLQTGNHPERVQKDALHFAARIAAKTSVQKHSRHVPVDYTLAKYVRKPRGSSAGEVTYQNEKTLFIQNLDNS